MADDQQGQKSAGLTLNLPSNNPFRNNAASPVGATSPASPFDDPPPRPLSRNPFLDPALTSRSSLSNIRSTPETMPLEKRPSLTAEEIFAEESLVDVPKPTGQPPGGARRGPPPPNREGRGPPPDRRGPPPNHRPTRSQEEALRARRKEEKEGRGDRGDRHGPLRSPQRRPDGPRRRLSDSSLIDVDKTTTEEERKQRERRRRERERRRRANPDQKDKFDLLDKLADLNIYGDKIVFHHDGPYDAVNRHRNREGSRRAPMQAFPEGSLNNTLGGAGPLNARPDHAAFMGHQDDEAFKEWSRGRNDPNGPVPPSKEVPVFDPFSRGNVLHGDQSLGLGTSTFLEGTPAARTAIQKREEERAAEGTGDGLQRKKSLAHRIRNMNRGGREFQSSGRVTNPEAGYGSYRSPTQSGPASASLSERNPFFSEYGGGGNSKGDDDFTLRRTETDGSKHSPTSPQSGPGLERRSTTDATGGSGGGSTGDDASQPKASGILGRMKSLKGRRQRPVPPSGDVEAAPVPGTAV
ncbi:Pal1 cell morphology protein-domain-containing protein [Dichotomopilus funicola]|uniref:Pal1 cell morphology protein-domain-containing protein n=1 Tax=Dichotomopilus funicola TaxID=1934379 RepID=A0AAN6V6P6_9PEZI|nr:Pal1 cell morphology protein-domain-containing protein [Dichotomopilus funicola]